MAAGLRLPGNSNLFGGLRCQQEFAINKFIFDKRGQHSVVCVVGDNQRQL
jgi:hypothetical protein